MSRWKLRESMAKALTPPIDQICAQLEAAASAADIVDTA
jgi:hypothetical protein